MFYEEETVNGLRELVREGSIDENAANAVAEHFGYTFSLLGRQRVEILVSIEIDPDGESDEEEISSNVQSRVESALERDFSRGRNVTVYTSIDSVQDA